MIIGTTFQHLTGNTLTSWTEFLTHVANVNLEVILSAQLIREAGVQLLARMEQPITKDG